MANKTLSYLTKKNDHGSILIYTLIVLTVLSLIGAIGIQTTWFEIKLAGNDRFINRLKIKAESTALAAVELVEKLPLQDLKKNKYSDWDFPNRKPWFSRGHNNQFDTESGEIKRTKLNRYIRDIANWADDEDNPANCAALVPEPDNKGGDSFSEEFQQCRFQVLDVEASEGSTIQTGNTYSNGSTLHNLYITGLSEENQGKCMIQIGLRKRY